MTQTIEIRVGDYVCSDFFSPMQGHVVSVGLAGKLPAYLIRTPHGKQELILKGQALLLWTKEEWDTLGTQRWARHD